MAILKKSVETVAAAKFANLIPGFFSMFSTLNEVGQWQSRAAPNVVRTRDCSTKVHSFSSVAYVWLRGAKTTWLI
jgi:hypothetical protein